MTKGNTDSWDDYCGLKFLKTTHVKDENDPFVVETVDNYIDDDENSKPRLSLMKNETTYLFDLNVTNSNFCRNSGINAPRNLIGKKLYFKKVLVNNPTTRKEVESLRICKVE